jgi:DNA polymerase III subunit alpha
MWRTLSPVWREALTVRPTAEGSGSSGAWREPEPRTGPRKGLGDFGAHDIKVGSTHVHGGGLPIRMRPNGNLKPMRWVSLHHHTTLSYLDGYQLPEAHVRRATELGMSAIGLTEHGNIDSHVKFEQAAESAGIKSLFGCEVYMPSGRFWRRDGTQTQRKHHLTLVAKDDVGYSNLLALVTGSWRDFYFEPTVTWDRLVKHRAGLYVLSGCQGSLLACAAVGGKGIPPERASYARALRVAQLFRETFGDHYFIEVQAFPELESTRRFNAMAGRLARAIGTRLVATLDCHYTMLEEQEVQKILHNLRPGEKRTLEEQAREWGYTAPLCPPPNDATIYRRLRATGLSKDEAVESITTTEDIAQSCTARLPKLPMVRFPLNNGESAIEHWRRLLKQGWRERGLHRLPPAERERYNAQLRQEMGLIEGKDFVDYFLLVAAGVRHIKSLDIPVGPARGSAAASVAAWLLGVTEVDPLRREFEGLLRFERFIDVTREDLPDIDLDFPSEARPILRRFYEDLMGPGCVNNIGTYIQFKGKNSLDDIARVFGVPKWEVDELKKFLIERSSGDLRASSTIEDTIEQFPQAKEVWDRNPDLAKGGWLEGNIKGFGVHAAGLVLSNEPITSVTSVAEREVPKGSGNVVQVVALDKPDAERQGLVKMDFLGLNTMSVLWDCCKRVGMKPKDLYAIPLDDQRVFESFRAGDLMGIFQFEGRATRYVTAGIKPERFSELMDCIALCRPGPLHNGAAREYAEIKAGIRDPERVHPVYDAITAPTQYQMVYQEQILNVAREIGGFPPAGVAEIRKIIALKKGEQKFQSRKEEFIRGASRHMPVQMAEMIWGNMVTSGAYAFNAAHCASYALISFYTMWFKVYYPNVFFAASLTEAATDPERTRNLLRDGTKGFAATGRKPTRVRKPSLLLSEEGWTPVGRNGGIRAGFRSINGIGPKTANVVAEFARKERPESWAELQRIKGFGPVTVRNIEEWLEDQDPWGAFLLDRNIAAVTEQLRAEELGPLPKPTHTATDLADDGLVGKMVRCVWLGTFLKLNIRDIYEQNRARGTELDPKTIKDPHLSEWALLTGEDQTDQLLITVDRWKFPTYRDHIMEFKPGRDLLLCEAIKPARSAVRKLNVRRMWVIEP